ncbi:FAD-dependent monooxygenase, partial [Salmonella enterica subsp. enterica serovar Anatum]|nr:FAD-dependent monooxygenase [Salmonella enterica subsp. enterica serovar Anatum]
GDAHDTRAIVQRLVEIRRCQAKLLGFSNYAAWKMADQMAKTPKWGTERITLVGDAAHPVAQYMAQGACMALEDAVTLGKALER